MKKIVITLAAIASLSGVALAGPGEGGKSNNEYANPTIFTMSVDAAPLAVVAAALASEGFVPVLNNFLFASMSRASGTGRSAGFSVGSRSKVRTRS